MYMRVFLPDSVINDNLSVPILSTEKLNPKDSVKDSSKKEHLFKSMPSADDMVALLNTRLAKAFPRISTLGFYLFSVLKFSRGHILL